MSKKKIYLSVSILVLGVLLIGVSLIIKKTDSDDNNESINSEEEVIERSNSIELPDSYKITKVLDTYNINNELILQSSPEAPYEVTAEGLVLKLEEYCEEDGFDPLICDTRESVIVNYIVDQENQVIIRLSVETTESSEVGEKFISDYRESIQTNSNDLVCEGGFLYNQEMTEYIYAIVDEGTSNGEVYNILENLADENDMEFLFRCDEF